MIQNAFLSKRGSGLRGSSSCASWPRVTLKALLPEAFTEAAMEDASTMVCTGTAAEPSKVAAC